MTNMFIFNQYVNLEFYLKEDKEYKNVVLELLQFLNYIKPNKFYFGKYYGDFEDYTDKYEKFNYDTLDNILKSNLNDYEECLIKICGFKKESFSLCISPYLKEVSVVKIRISKYVFERNKTQILNKCDKLANCHSVMFAFADAAVGNPYFHKGYGEIKFGAHWVTWYGEWSLKYFKDKHIEKIKDNSYDFVKKETFIRSQLYVSPWKYRSKQFHKTYRNFMRKVKIEDIVLEYNKKHEFSEIEKKQYSSN